ncbi:hypothetical protein KAU11_00870 [Candidatus Babeliales bacterium]|nr:hypothetical protein [Candidatus Babeliales bacterium]
MPIKEEVKIGFLLLVAGALSSCSKQSHSKNNLKSKSPETILQAKYSDIPTPLNSILLPTERDDTSTSKIELLTMQSSLSAEQMHDFYIEKLITQGWDINDFSTHNDTLLVCEKPHKECIVSTINTGQKTQAKESSLINIFIKQKEP